MLRLGLEPWAVTPEHTQQLNVKNIPASMKRSSISVTRFVSKRNSDTNDDDNSKSSDDSDYNKLGETFSRATKFLGTIVKGQNSNGDSYHDSNLDIDQYLNERYKEVNDYNLYNSFRRESGATKTNNYSKDDNMATVDDADSDDASRVTMPPLDEGDLGDIAKAEENDRGSVNDGIKPFAGISPPRWVSDVLSQSAEIVATESTARRRSSEISSGYSNPLAQSCVVVDTGSTARRRSSEISSGYSNPLTQSFVNVGARSTAARRSSEISSGYSNPLAQSCVIVDTGSTARRRSSEISSGYSNQLTQSFVNVGARSTAGRRSSEISSGLKNSVWSYAAGDSMSASATLVSSGGMDSSDPLLIDHHAKSRASFVRRNMSQAATGTQSFRDVQQLMKDKGAVTGNAIRYMLQEAAEEHAAKNVTSVFDESEPSTQQTPRFNGVDTGNYCSDNNYLGDAVSKIEERSLQQHEAQQLRLERDPMFGKLSDTAIRPYISIPSRESKVETFMVLLRNVADYGESRLLTVHGTKFVGKTKLIKHVIDTVQSQGLGYTVLSSVRSANDILTSFFCFREITSAALRACDSVTESFDENNDLEQAGDIQRELKGDEEDDELKLILERLKSRKILNKSDQLMISRILPAVMDDQLLSLLKGRNPTALIKDIAASLFKILIPLQPFCFVFEADGDDCDIDPSSWHLIEEMLLSAGTQCPQMLMIAISRHSLLDHVPPSIIATQFVNIHIEKMDKCDTACYIRALFCDANIDRNMQIDPHVADAVYHRANGCPLFTERIVLWSQGKDLIELDETRNAVALNLPTIVRNDHEHGCDSSNHEMLLLKTLPANLNEEILEKINNLPHQVLDALKIAAQIGITFDVDKYSSLCLHGFHDSLQELITSHGIFYKTNGHCYRWRHVAVYEAVLTIIISNERFEIQGRIADSLQDLPLSRICNNGVQYARHYALAERWDEAFDRYMEAGDEAEKKHDFAGAVGIYQQAKICLTKTRNNPSLQRRLSPHAALGLCLRELMRYDDAEAELEFCLSQIMTVPEYLRNAEIELEVVTTLAMLKQYQSKYSEALAMYARALPLARANKERHSEVWLAHHVASCAEIHRKAGDLLQAKTLHMEALAYRELAVKEKSCTNLELAISFTQLGCTMSGLGDNLCAFNLHKKALAARVDHLDFYHSLVSESLNYCADALQALDRGCEGVPLSMHAVKIRKFVFGSNHPAYAHALSVLASCYHQVGRSFDALGLLEECLEICEKSFSKNHANMIPNLMLYGAVLSVMGNCEKARVAYTRALDIHNMNFTEEQNTHQLVKLQNALSSVCVKPQTKENAILCMPISFESSKTHVVVCADFGHRSSDEYMLCCASSLQRMGILKLVSVVAVSPPQVAQANIAREALDSLLLSNVPVAYGTSSMSESRTANDAMLSADNGAHSAHMSNTGAELLRQVLLKMPEKSLVIMCTACFDGVSEVIDTHRDLFASKVKEVVIIGSVKPVRKRVFIEPEDFGVDKEDAFAKNVYSACQELDIPTVTLFKNVARGFPFSSTLVDALALSNHMVSTKIQQAEEMHMNSVWEVIKQLKSETSYFSPNNVDIKRFHKYSLGGEPPTAGHQHNIWPSIKSINLELVFGLLCCISTYQNAHFRWESHQVKGTVHKVCRHSNSKVGIINAEALSNEIYMLIGFALRVSLANTSC